MPPSVWASAKESFKKGLAAADLGQWSEAVGHLRRAIAEDPRESTEQVFLSGVFSRPYLPHFYLGEMLVSWDSDSHCSEAVQAWQESLRQGVVRDFRRQLKDLEEGRAVCLEKILPGLKTRGDTAVEKARERLTALGETSGDEGVDARLRSLRSDLRRAEDLLSQGIESSDPEKLDQAVALAGRLETEASTLAETLATRRNDALEAERSRVRGSWLDAEGSRRALGDLALASDRQKQQAEDWSRALERIQGQMATADMDALQNLGRESAEAASFFDRLRIDLAAKRRGVIDERPPESPPPTVGSPEPRRTEDVGPPTVEQAPDPRIRQWLDRANRWLTDTESTDPGPLLVTVREDLQGMVAAAEASPPARIDPWIGQLRNRLFSLRLVAGIDAFFRGQHRQVLNLLPTATEAEQDRGSAALRAQGHLFRSAAQFHLFRLGGGSEQELLGRAEEEARLSLLADPTLSPSPDFFSPAFRELFRRLSGDPPPDGSSDGR